MKKYGKEFRSPFFARRPELAYLSAKERYIYALPTPKYRFNVIGVGSMGQEHILMTFLEGRAMIHGIYDTNPRSIKAAQNIIHKFAPDITLKVYDTLEKACNDPDVDGLIISTPNYTHINVFRTAIQSGKHILMEKPMATTIPDAYEMIEATQEYPAVFQVGLQYRYKAMYREAIHEALQRKSIGNLHLVQIAEHRVPFLDKINQWNKFNQYSGGTLVEKCCHYFDMLNLFAQSTPKTVFATGSQAVNFKNFTWKGQSSDILDNALVTIEYENGIRAGFTLCMFAPQFYEELVLCGDEGRLKAYENHHFLDIGEPHTRLEVYRGESQPSRITIPAYPSHIEGAGHNGASFYEHQYFVDNIEGQPTTVATPEEGFWSIVVGYAAQQAILQQRPISISELLEELNIPI